MWGDWLTRTVDGARLRGRRVALGGNQGWARQGVGDGVDSHLLFAAACRECGAASVLRGRMAYVGVNAYLEMRDLCCDVEWWTVGEKRETTRRCPGWVAPLADGPEADAVLAAYRLAGRRATFVLRFESATLAFHDPHGGRPRGYSKRLIAAPAPGT